MKIFLIVLFICNITIAQNVNHSKVFSIPINSKVKQEKISTNGIVSAIDYVILEPTPNSLLSRIQLIVVTSKYIFPWDSHAIYQFDRSGKFIRKIGKSGKGPGEYQGVRDLVADESKGLLYILPNWTRNVLVYDFNGKYIRTINFPGSYDKVDIVEGKYLVFQSAVLEPSLLSTEILDMNGKSIYKFNSRVFKNTKDMPFGRGWSNVTYTYNHNLFVKESRSDTVYRITSKGLIPHFVFNFAEQKPPIIIPDKEIEKFVRIFNISETDKYIISFFHYKGFMCTSLYDKSTRKSIMSIPLYKQSQGIINNFDYGPNFLLSVIPFAAKTNQKDWICILRPEDILEYDTSKKPTGKFLSLMKQYTEDDNPVVMIIHQQ